jgi:8-oxo-dGTP diphosphatase
MDDSGPIRVAIAVVMDRGRILISRRGRSDHLAGYWEFPGGKCLSGEPPEQCVIREVREEVGLDIQPEQELQAIHFSYPHRHIVLFPFICRPVSGVACPLDVAEVRWILPDDLRSYRFPPANDSLIAELIDRFGQGPPSAA